MNVKKRMVVSVLWIMILFLSGMSSIAIVSYGFGETLRFVQRGFTGGQKFYAYAASIGAVLLLCVSIGHLWGLLRPKVRNLSLLVLAAGVALAITGYEINRVYENSFERVSEQEVDLTLYEPFRKNTKAVSLNETSSLQLTGDLPRLDGATALYPIYAAFARATYPEGDYPAKWVQNGNDTIVCTTTGEAYNRLINGETDIIFATSPSEKQIEMATSKGVELKTTAIGREAFVFFVNAKNPIDQLTITDIQRIYAGKATNWREFGGENKDIRAFQRPEGSGSQIMLNKFLGGVELMTPPTEDIPNGMSTIITNVADYKNYKNAIGYSFLYYANEMVKDDKIKLIALNGVAPTRENVANESYPYADNFYAITTTTAETENPNVEKLIEWMVSEQGQYLVEKTGYTPLKR